MSYEAWGEPPEEELPDGCWSEDQVKTAQDAVLALLGEPVYEGGKKENGISVRLIARMYLLRRDVGLVDYLDPFAVEAEKILSVQEPAL